MRRLPSPNCVGAYAAPNGGVFIKVTIESLYNLFRLISFDAKAYFFKGPLHVIEMHVLVVVFGRIEELQRLIVVKFWTA